MRNNISQKKINLVFFFLLCLTITTTGGKADNYKCNEKERRALLDFKALIHQDPLHYLSTWTREEEATNDCCYWNGVTCNNQTGHVTSLVVRGDLEGKISPSLANLTYLNDLDLSYNSFHGTIPSSITSLAQLRSLKLCSNKLTGTIPMSIGSMNRLLDLDVSLNDLTGTIPTSIGSLTQLSYIDLSYNDFSGTLPREFGNLTNLEILSLGSFNNFTLENLDWMSHMSQLFSLSIHDIYLGKAHNWVNVILSLRRLYTLELDGSDLSQVMHPYSNSSVNSSFSSSIGYLSLRNNNLNSSMYYWLFPLTSQSLISLDLSENKLDEIPKYLGNLCSLTSLSFSLNSMIAKFPDFLNNLSGCTSVMLQKLTASNSQFIGSLSDHIQTFSALEELDLSHNQLNGIVSEKVWELPSLLFLDISSNSLKGPISEKFGKTNISYVNYSNNSLEGFLSEAHMSNMSYVDHIDLSSNNLYSHIPNVSSCVRWLDLSKNKLFGEILFLCQIVDGFLFFLDLSNNSLTGQIPDCLWHIKYLEVLNLGYNNLFGRLPASVESLTHLNVLFLNNNNFYGELPLSLKNCTKLNVLYLGDNGFSGNVPFWIGENLSLLYAISLRSNNFSGTIPLQLCRLIYLQILDLSMNTFYGSIPSCLGNLTSMVQDGSTSNINMHFFFGKSFRDRFVDHVMIHWQGNVREFSNNLGLMKIIDLSRNNLSGKIPHKLTNLHKLIALDLSMNALYGEIPPEIGLMKELQILDLSRNNLSGQMPKSMSKMFLLDYLDVSYNKLSGRIPSNTQLQSFEPSRYIGNAGLCGVPLSRYCPGDKELNVRNPIGRSEDDEEGDLNRWFYIGGVTGFAVGFWTVCGGILLNRQRRNAFFHFMNVLQNWVHVKVIVFIANLQRITHP